MQLMNLRRTFEVMAVCLSMTSFAFARPSSKLTAKPQLCEGVQDFAVEINPKKNLVVFHNPTTRVISLFECETETSYCRSMYHGPGLSYCQFEVNHRLSALNKIGLFKSANNVYSIATGSLLAKVFQSRALYGNAKNLLTEKNISTCHDMVSMLSILNGNSWQQVTSTLPPEHINLMQMTSVGSNLPILSTALTVTNLIDKSEAEGLLGESLLSRRRPERGLHAAITCTKSTRPKSLVVAKGRKPGTDICQFMRAGMESSGGEYKTVPSGSSAMPTIQQ